MGCRRCWQHTQRQEYRHGKLAAERVKRLSTAGMVWDMQDAAWEEGFSHFEKLPLNQDRSRQVKRYYVTEHGYKLGAWQHTQRQAYKHGQLTEERIKRLEDAGILWKARRGPVVGSGGRGRGGQMWSKRPSSVRKRASTARAVQPTRSLTTELQMQ